MAELIRMPKMGLTMTEGKITKWFKEEGQTIEKGEALMEVATDKISNEVEAEAGGTLLKILVAKGSKALVKEPVAIIGEAGEDIGALLADAGIAAEEKPGKKESVKAAPREEAKTAFERAPGEYVKASPLAKKTARDKGFDLSRIEGTGPDGRIVEKDVLAFSPSKSVKASSMAGRMAERLGVSMDSIRKEGRVMKEDVVRFYKNNNIEELAAPYEERVDMSPMRQVISERMAHSWTTAPAVTYEISVDITKLKAMKDELKPFVKITYTDLIVKILSKVLLKHKALNCTIDGDEIIYRNYVNMGVAVAVDNGLLVPVVKYANIKSLGDVSKEIKELAEKSRTNQLDADALSGGTFTVTNLGMYGIEAFSPIINQPESAILGICGITNTPVVNDAMEIEIKPLMKLCLTADHRVVDGAVAAEFIRDLKQALEHPAMLLV